MLFSHCGPRSQRGRLRDRGFFASAPFSRPPGVMARSMAFATTFALACNPHREFATAWTNVAARCAARSAMRSEEHTSELQPHLNLVCRLLLEKKNQHRIY